MANTEAMQRNSRNRASELRELRGLLFSLLLVLSPLLVVYGLVEALAWRIGETVPLNEIARWQGTDGTRIWRSEDARSYLFYKLERTLLLKPEVLVLGQSRVELLRAREFAPYPFYNAAMAAFTFSHYINFIERITALGYAPRVLFCNFDYWMFGKDFDSSGNWGNRFYDDPPTHWDNLKAVVDAITADPIRRIPLVIARLLAGTEDKGLYAFLNGTGFTPEGALVVLNRPQPPPPGTADHLQFRNDQIVVGKSPLVLDDHMARGQIANFERFMDLARSHGITVVGIQFPFYARVFDELNSNPKAGIWREFRSTQMRQFFESKGLLFFDFADVAPYADQPRHFWDSLHPDETLDDIVIKRVLADSRVRALLPRVQLEADKKNSVP